MTSKIDWYKLLTDKTLQEWKQTLPTMESLTPQWEQELKTKYPLTPLGVGEQRVTLREEERQHIQIIGTTQEGKSRLLAHLIRADIDSGKGVCFLDPSDRGDTLYDVLRYCYTKRIKKVCLIDPLHRFKYNSVPVINPFHKGASYKDASVANVAETIKTVFGVKDTADTPRINKYLPAILRILWGSKSTLYDSIYFTHKDYEPQRELMYEKLDSERDVMLMRGVYRTLYTQEALHSTINRLQPFYDDTLKLIFGYPEGIDFVKMISEGWIILVNLYSGLGFEPIHTRLLGTTIINELIFALDRLVSRGFRGRYHLYIDEAGDYANRRLADLLAKKQKSGLRVTVAHQYYGQFEDRYVLDAINQLCKIKIGFYMPDPKDRLEFVKSAYGGELADRDVSYVLSSLKKQYAVVKKPKKPAAIVRIPDTPKVELPDETLERYIMNIYSYPWYKSPKEVFKSFHDRFPKPTHSESPESRKAPYGKATRTSPIPHRIYPDPPKQAVPTGDEEPQKPARKKPIKI